MAPSINDILIYESEYRLIICQWCRYVVLDSQLSKHLHTPCHIAEHHPQYHSLFQQFFHQHPQRVQRHQDIEYPIQPIAPIAALSPPHPHTFQCIIDLCGWIGENLRRIHEHCKQTHGWQNPRSAGRPHPRDPPQSHPSPPWRVVASQQFIPRGRGSQRFAVDIHAAHTPVPVQSTTRPPWDVAEQAMKQAIIERERQIEAAEEARIRAHEPREVNPWVERMGWAVHLLEEDRTALRALLDPPDPEKEPILAKIGQRFARIVTVAQRTIWTRLNVFSRFEMHRKQADQMPSMPFQARMEPDTMARYQEVWQRMIRYIVRSVQQQTSRFQLTEHQQAAMEQMIEAVVEEDDESTADEDPIEETQDPADRPLSPADQAILRWCIRMLDHRLGGKAEHEYHSGIVSGLAVMGIKEQGGWETALIL